MRRLHAIRPRTIGQMLALSPANTRETWSRHLVTYKFSARSGKYVWLSLSGLLPLALSLGWLTAIAPSSQQQTRQETQWRQQRQAAKQRQDFLADNQIYSDYSQVVLEGVSADQGDIKPTMAKRLTGESFRGYAPGQIVRLLDQHHQFIGYLRDNQAYLEVDNPGLASTARPDVPTKLNQSAPL